MSDDEIYERIYKRLCTKVRVLLELGEVTEDQASFILEEREAALKHIRSDEMLQTARDMGLESTDTIVEFCAQDLCLSYQEIMFLADTVGDLAADISEVMADVSDEVQEAIRKLEDEDDVDEAVSLMFSE